MTRVSLLPTTSVLAPTPWIIAIMVAIALVIAAGSLALGRSAQQFDGALAGRATVQVIDPFAPSRERQARAVVQLLSATPGVVEVRRVPDVELRALLKPWLGGGVGAGDVPVPALIEASVTGIGVAELATRLARVAPDARIELPQRRLAPLVRLLETLRAVAVLAVALVLTAMAAAIVLAVRGSFDTYRETVSILHAVGATDRQMTRLFEWGVARDAAVGAALGTLVGLGVVVLLAQRITAAALGLAEASGLEPLDWALLLALPLGTVALAVAVGRATVLRELAERSW